MDKRLLLACGLFGAAAVAAFVWQPAHHEVPSLAVNPVSPAPAARVSSLVVYVAGAVKSPGVYTVAAGSRAIAAVKAAGGPTGAADLAGVNLAERLEDGQEVLVPDRDSLSTGSPKAHHARGRRGRHAHHAHAKRRRSSPDPAPATPVDLNRADASALSQVPGIGETLADRIVAFRDLNGPFGAIDDLLDVGGMSAARLDRASKFLSVR